MSFTPEDRQAIIEAIWARAKKDLDAQRDRVNHAMLFEHPAGTCEICDSFREPEDESEWN